MDKWNAKKEVYATAKQLIAKHLPDLVMLEDDIAILFREKSPEVDGKPVAGTTAKAPEILGILGDKDWKFIITLGADVWDELADKERQALLFHHLSACGLKENPTTGNTKYFKKPPDVAFYEDEVKLFGFWRTSGTQPEDDVIADLFGADEEEDKNKAAGN